MAIRTSKGVTIRYLTCNESATFAITKSLFTLVKFAEMTLAKPHLTVTAVTLAVPNLGTNTTYVICLMFPNLGNVSVTAVTVRCGFDRVCARNFTNVNIA
jgi:hypothetical protein